MKTTPEAASPRTRGLTAKTAHMYGSRAARLQRQHSSTTPVDGMAMAQSARNFKSNEVPTQNFIKRSSSQSMQTQASSDPYSLSDHEDEMNRTRDPRASRKRVHLSAFPTSKPSSRNQDGNTRLTGAPDHKPVEKSSPQNQVATSVRQARQQKTRSNISITELTEPIKPESTQRNRRPRLIDTLATQKTVDSDADSDSDDNLGTRDSNGGSQHPVIQTATSNTPALLPQEPNVVIPTYSPRKQANPSITSTKVKHTYGQSRTIASKSLTVGGSDHSDKDKTGVDDFLATPLVFPAPDPFDTIDDSDEESKRSSKKLKGIHELRRAGANMRFTDELGDLLARIGPPASRPSSMRRNALLELAEKLKRPDFADQFRDHADRDGLVENIGGEKDIISGFALSAALVEFLSYRPAPHLLQRLAAEGAGKLIGSLLAHGDDIGEIAAWRKFNLPRHTQTALRGVRLHLITMDVWMGYTVSCLSPRTVALKLLNILYGSREIISLDMLWRGCVDDLSAIANAQADEPLNDGVDLAHAVVIFEEQSNVAREALQESDWLRQSCSTAFFLFRSMLDVWSDARSCIHLAALKMSINVTNTVRGATEFRDASLLADLSSRICSGIMAVRKSLIQEGFDKDSYDALVLVLGVMINIQEHCPSARETIPRESIEHLASSYVENRLATGEADSEDKSRLSVALGYLAVLLGYLCLSGPGLSAIRDNMGSDGLRGLRVSIREFINVYKSVDSKVQDLEGLVSELQARLI